MSGFFKKKTDPKTETKTETKTAEEKKDAKEEIREKLINTAVFFLGNPKIVSRPDKEKRNFLKTKGFNK